MGQAWITSPPFFPRGPVCAVSSARTLGTKSGELWFHQEHPCSGPQRVCWSLQLGAAPNSPTVTG